MIAGKVIGLLAAGLAVMACLGACGGGSDVTPPNQVVLNYLAALAEGNFKSACTELDTGTRDSLQRSTGSGCAGLFARCLPNQSTRDARDQSQLLYANAPVTMHGRLKAESSLSGTAVARETRDVTLRDERGVWKLTSYGRAITRCARRSERERRLHKHGHSHRTARQ